MVTVILLILPLLIAFTAWVTAYLLISGILYPLRPIRIAGISIHGFLPYCLETHAESIATVLAGEIVNSLQSNNLAMNTADVKPIIEAHLDTYLRIRLREKMPVIATFIGDSTLAKLRESMIEEIDVLLPQVMAAYVSSTVTVPNVRHKIAAIISNITPEKLEQIAQPFFMQARRRVSLVFALGGLFAGGLFSGVFYVLQHVLQYGK